MIFVLDASGIDGRTPDGDFRILKEEINAYNPELLTRPYLVVLNKIDTEESKENIENFYKSYPKDSFYKIMEISAAEGTGLTELLKTIRICLQNPVPNS